MVSVIVCADRRVVRRVIPATARGRVGVAISPSGLMVAPGRPLSDAVIYKPLEATVQQYKLGDRDSSRIVADARYVVVQRSLRYFRVAWAAGKT